ncbi:Uncharacterized protein APZ42_018174 [Daphnia magna]|uniref:Uncharacterized protein n=1 Tax=Daphnia magna TaxID=35525 RepID=A0A0P6I3G1_9CRUS|nr:Uncharacterized protein APZ42_018174 [Daphnia magna]
MRRESIFKLKDRFKNTHTHKHTQTGSSVCLFSSSSSSTTHHNHGKADFRHGQVTGRTNNNNETTMTICRGM